LAMTVVHSGLVVTCLASSAVTVSSAFAAKFPYAIRTADYNFHSSTCGNDGRLNL